MVNFNAYIPIDRRYALHHATTLPDRTEGAVLFADISGFATLASDLEHALGPRRGADALMTLVNRLLTALIGEVHHYGGSVISFSGDAITCWFDEKIPYQQGEPGNSPHRATACALAMQEILQRETGYNPPTRFNLSIKVSVVAGKVRRFLVGSPQNQLMDTLAGELLDRSASADKLTQPGQVVVGAEVLAAFGSHLQVLDWLVDAKGEAYALVEGISMPVSAAPWPDLPIIDPEIARDWLLPHVYHRLQRGEGAFLAELRPSVAIFLNFSGINYDTDGQAEQKLDLFVRWMQSLLEAYGGYFLDLIVGDKGSYALASIGSTSPQENNALHAVTAAHALQALPAELGFIGDLRIGISLGPMLVGAYGSETRRSFSKQGSETILAARLMEQASPGEILATVRIAEAVQDTFTATALGGLQIKGWSQTVPIFAVGQRKEARDPESSSPGEQAPIIGRNKELEIFASHLEALAAGQTGTIMVQGETGMGKSRLALAFLENGRAQGISAYLGSGDAIERATPYHAWRSTFREILNLSQDDGESDLLEKIWAVLPEDRQDEETAAIIDRALGLSKAAKESPAAIGEIQADTSRKLLSTILAKSLSSSGYILIFDDSQWIDSASWALLADVLQNYTPGLTIITSRPMADSDHAAKKLRSIMVSPDTVHLRLSPLTAAESITLVTQDLGVNSLPQPVADFILQRAEGHPFFSEEIAHALIDAGFLQIQDQELILVSRSEDLDTLDFPATMQGVIASRIDHLDAPTQLTLKVASVIGANFSFENLYDIHPIAGDRENLHEHLGELIRLDIIVHNPSDFGAAYDFKHQLIQEIAYDRLLHTQRQQLHQAVAEWIEATYAGKTVLVYPLLAHHWGKAAEAQTGSSADRSPLNKALHYLEKSGEQALQNSAYREAIAFFNDAVNLAAERNVNVSSERQAGWLQQLGETYHQWGQWSEARQYLAQAAALFGKPIPVGRAPVIGGIIGQLGKQVRNRLWPGRFVNKAADAERETILRIAHIYQSLGELSYLTNDTAFSLFAILRGLNLSEYGGMSRELVKAYCDISVMVGLFGSYSMAETYGSKGWQTAEILDDLEAKVRAKQAVGLYAMNAARLDQSRENLEEALAFSEKLGHRRLWGDSLGLLARTVRFQGDMSRASKLYGELGGPKSGVMMHRVWAHNSAALIALRKGDLGQALACLDLARSLPGETPEPGQVLITWSYLGFAYMQQGDYAQALDTAGKAEELLQQIKASAYTHFEPMSAVVEVYLSFLETPHCESDAQEITAAAKKICRSLQRQSTPLGRPAANLYQGWYEWLNGKQSSAFKRWQKGLAAAQEAGMPYELGRLHLEIGRHLPEDDPQRQAHIEQAANIFSNIGAAYQHDRAQQFL